MPSSLSNKLCSVLCALCVKQKKREAFASVPFLLRVFTKLNQ